LWAEEKKNRGGGTRDIISHGNDSEKTRKKSGIKDESVLEL